ncbi:MAG TPA: hypothetical protein VFQ51_06180, partial [Vicinamibacteria bacterium]|nr:hypothetical protein [Vicinamibacteria bacterium]
MSARRPLAGWLVLAVLLVLQWALLRAFALREITWSYPVGMDQAGYLLKSYTLHEHIWQGGLAAGLSESIHGGTPQGFLLQLEAALVYLVLGPSRWSALTLNFVHFAALQCLIVLALRTLHRGWSLPAFALGLLLCAVLPFQYYGGIADFRLDFAAACLFGMFAVAGACSDGLRRRGWTIATLALGTACVWTRTIAVIYVFGVLGAFAALAVLRRGHPGRLATVKRTLLLAAALAGLTAPPLWVNRKAIHDYYVVGHVTGKEKDIRARQAGVTTIGASLAFYPRSVAREHAGPAFLSTAGVAGAAALLSLTPWFRRRRDAAAAEPLVVDPTNALAFLALCVVVPIAVLTANESKSPVVGGVVVPPLACLVAIASWLPLRRGAGGLRTLKVLGALALALGVWSFVGGMLRPFRSLQEQADARTMVDVYDALAHYGQDLGWRKVRVTTTSIEESLWPPLLPVLSYERQGWLPQLTMPDLTLFEPDPDAFLEGIRRSDIVFLRQPRPTRTSFPYDDAMARLYPQARALCDRELALVKRVDVSGLGLRVYVRPAAVAAGASGDWITASGLRLRANPRLLADWPRLRFAGGWTREWLGGRTPRVCATLDLDGRFPVAVPARMTVDGATYTVDVDVPPDTVRAAADASVRVVFDTYFFPGPTDPRRLVVLAPQRVDLLRIDGDGIPAAACPFDMETPAD